jgi:hypothetical protein
MVEILLAQNASRSVACEGKRLRRIRLFRKQSRRLQHRFPLVAARSGEHLLGKCGVAQAFGFLALASAPLPRVEHGSNVGVGKRALHPPEAIG